MVFKQYPNRRPHLHVPGATQFVTYRLADSIPLSERRAPTAGDVGCNHRRYDAVWEASYRQVLEQMMGSRVLRLPFAADCVVENWLHHEPHYYTIRAWVIMPTHVHILIETNATRTIGAIVQSWKTYTSRRLKIRFPDSVVDDQFWEDDYWDRYMRDEQHLAATVAYIRQNPVKAGLVKTPEDWEYLWVEPSLAAEYGYDVQTYVERRQRFAALGTKRRSSG